MWLGGLWGMPGGVERGEGIGSGTSSSVAAGRDTCESRGQVRWVVDVAAWDPGEGGWEAALASIAEGEKAQVRRFRRDADRRRALMSRLLVRALSVELGGATDAASVDVQRTAEGKPFLAGHSRTRAAEAFRTSSFNFNISHHGDLVCLAAEPSALVGIDVMNHAGGEGMAVPTEPSARKCADASPDEGAVGRACVPGCDGEDYAFFRPFLSCYTASEWALVHSRGGWAEQLAEFYRLWTMKESLVKAIGLGLGFELQRAEFSYVPGREGVEARVAIDGLPHSGWRFFLHEMKARSGSQHWICVALGPLTEACSNFLSGAFPGLSLDTSPRHREPPEAEEPTFRVRTVPELIAACALSVHRKEGEGAGRIGTGWPSKV